MAGRRCRGSDDPSGRAARLGYAARRWTCATAPRTWRSAPRSGTSSGEHLVGEFAELGGRGGSGDETFGFEVRLRWEKVLAEGGWTCLGWPTEHGGRGASMTEQVIFNEEYARAAAPGRVNVMGEGLLGPTLIHYGTEQKARFLPPIREGTELWCQGYSEPDAGSDLANVKTRAVRDGDEWVVTGQKVWTSLAHQADWCFVVCRTDPGSTRHKGLSYLLVPMDQPGVEVRPITQLTRTSEFNEVFFDGARTHVDNVVGDVGEGWRVALATLAFERGVALLGHQLGFRRELDRHRGAGPGERPGARPGHPPAAGPGPRRADHHALQHAAQPLGRRRPGGPARSLHRQALLGQLAPAPGRAGPRCARARPPPSSTASRCPNGGYELSELQRSFLFARSETIYGGSNQIQRNIIGERVLGLPPEPKGVGVSPSLTHPSTHRPRPRPRAATACWRARWSS